MIPLWLKIAFQELNSFIAEEPGDEDNPRIIEYLSRVFPDNQYLHDSVPWCSAFIEFCLQESGIIGTRSASARSWASWEEEDPEGLPGSIAVFWREDPDSWKGHVGFLICKDDQSLFILGGNQNNAVTIKEFSYERLLTIRKI